MIRMQTIDISDRNYRMLREIIRHGYRFDDMLGLEHPKTEDEVLAGLFVVAEGEGYIDMEWADKECPHYYREEINLVLDGKTPPVLWCKDCGKYLD